MQQPVNGNGHDSFSLFGVFLGIAGAVVVFVLLFYFAPILARKIGY